MKRRSDYFYTTDHKKIYFEEIEYGTDKSCMVLLNGLTQTTLSWEWCLRELEWSGKVILCDFVFQGKSDKKGAVRNFDRHAKDVKELLDHLKIDRACISGISYGSLAAQHFAVNHPEKIVRLILISTFAHKTPFYRAIEQSWKQALHAGGYALLLDVMLPYVLSEQYFFSPIIPIEVLKKMRIEVKPEKEALEKLMEATEKRKDYLEELGGVHCPTLIVQGEKDLLFPPYFAEVIQKRMKNCKLVIIPHKGHTLNLEAAPELSSLLSQFCR